MSTIISIIIPCFNCAHLIKVTLKSILNQTFNKWEAIIIDDGSSDNSVEIIQSFCKKDNRFKFFERDREPKGPSVCRNIGVKNTIGEYLMFLDSDDFITPSCLENRVKYLQQNPHLDFAVFPQASFKVTPGDIPGYFSKLLQSKDKYLQYFIEDKHPWQTSAPVWKRDSFLQLKGFREDYTLMEDPELHIRAILENMNFNIIKGEPDFYYRLPDKTPEQLKKFWEHAIKGRIKFFPDLKSLLIKYNTWEKYKVNVSKAYLSFQKKILLSRSVEFNNEFNIITAWAKKEHLLGRFKSVNIKLYHTILKNENSIIKYLPLKRILYFFI